MKIEEIAMAVNSHFGVEVRTKSRKKTVALARHIAIYIACEEFSLPEVGEYFERDHSTIIHSRKKIGDDLARYQDDIDCVRAKIVKKIVNVQDILIETEKGAYTLLEKYHMLRGFLIAHL